MAFSLADSGVPARTASSDVVEAGEGELRVKLLLALAVRVEPLAEFADALLERAFVKRGEWEGIEATGFHVNGIVANAEPGPRFEGPRKVN